MKQGFSLIELLVVIAIVGVLSAIAIPAYKNYVAKSKIVSVIHLMENIKSQIVEKYDRTGAYPTTMLGSSGADVAYTAMPNVTRAFYGIYNGWAFFVVKINSEPLTASTDGWIAMSVRNVGGAWVTTCGAWAPLGDAHAFGDTTKTALLPPSCSSPSVYNVVIA